MSCSRNISDQRLSGWAADRAAPGECARPWGRYMTTFYCLLLAMWESTLTRTELSSPVAQSRDISFPFARVVAGDILTTELSNNERKGAFSARALVFGRVTLEGKGVRISLLDDSGVRIFCACSSSSNDVIFAIMVSNSCSTRPSLSPTWFPLDASRSSGYS
jgi:hypothetical protein